MFCKFSQDNCTDFFGRLFGELDKKIVVDEDNRLIVFMLMHLYFNVQIPTIFWQNKFYDVKRIYEIYFQYFIDFTQSALTLILPVLCWSFDF